jgi:DnaJ-class molecular chaperone
LWFYEEDFDLVCEYSQYSPTAVRKKVMKAIKKMEKKYDDKRREKDMSRCRGNGFIKTQESVESKKQIISQCPQCNSQGEIYDKRR